MTANLHHDNPIIGVIRMKLVQIRLLGSQTKYYFVIWPFQLDEIDVRLLRELEVDADRANVELARIVGLSPAATLNRVRRMKESGVIRKIAARLDSATAGFTLQVYVLVTLARHDEAAERRFNAEVTAMDNIISADSVAGETDALLMIVARDVAELQLVLSRLSTRGGAQRLITLLRLAELKPSSPLPLRATSVQSRPGALERARAGRSDGHGDQRAPSLMIRPTPGRGRTPSPPPRRRRPRRRPTPT